jgi:prepilin signal peptidase PulO-like enzyme (type II secretory pathway)
VGIVLLSLKIKKKSDLLPFGPFLIIGGLCAIWLESFFWKWILG